MLSFVPSALLSKHIERLSRMMMVQENPESVVFDFNWSKKKISVPLIISLISGKRNRYKRQWNVEYAGTIIIIRCIELLAQRKGGFANFKGDSRSNLWSVVKSSLLPSAVARIG